MPDKKKKPKSPPKKPFNYKPILPWFKTEKKDTAPPNEPDLRKVPEVIVREGGKWPSLRFPTLFLRWKSGSDQKPK